MAAAGGVTTERIYKQEESRLLEYLMTGYDKRVRPVRDISQNVSVKVGITLTQIFDIVSLISCKIIFLWVQNLRTAQCIGREQDRGAVGRYCASVLVKKLVSVGELGFLLVIIWI